MACGARCSHDGLSGHTLEFDNSKLILFVDVPLRRCVTESASAACAFHKKVPIVDTYLTELLSPVFNVEVLDATELIGVVGHERDPERTGVCRDEEIVGADQLSMHFERRTDLCVV